VPESSCGLPCVFDASGRYCVDIAADSREPQHRDCCVCVRTQSPIESRVMTLCGRAPVLQAREHAPVSATGAAADFGQGQDVQLVGLPPALRGVRVT
jgi:hypothetical protein